MAPSRRLLIAILATILPLADCKLVRNEAPQVASAEGGGSAPASDNPASDPEKMAQEIWQPRLLPYLRAKAGPFAEVRQLLQSSPDQAGQRFGYRAKAEGTPWTLVT